MLEYISAMTEFTTSGSFQTFSAGIKVAGFMSKKSSQDTKDEANNNENRVYLIDFISISLKFQVKTKIHSPRLRIIHTVGRIAFRVHTIYRRRSKSQQIIATYIET